jgi:hypothetical protein
VDAILAPEAPKPYTGDPNSENMAAAGGTPLKVRPDQDHGAHCTAHLLMLQVPGFAQSPAGQIVFRHAVEHELWGIWAAQAKLASQAQPPMQFPQPGQQMDPQTENVYAQQTAQAMQAVVEKLKAMTPMPPGMTDPALIQAETNAEEVKLRDEREREKLKNDQIKTVGDQLLKMRTHLDNLALEYEKLTTGVEQDQIALEAQMRTGVADRMSQGLMHQQSLGAQQQAAQMRANQAPKPSPR